MGDRNRFFYNMKFSRKLSTIYLIYEYIIYCRTLRDDFKNEIRDFNSHAPDRFTPSRARCAENCGSALTHR